MNRYPAILVSVSVSFGFVFVEAFQGKVPRIVAVPLAINQVANLLFMSTFSGMKNIPLAAVDISSG